MIVGWLAEFVAGKGLRFINDQLGRAHERKIAAIEAANDQARLDADNDIAELQGRRDALIAEARNSINQWFRAFIAVGPTLYIFKLFAVDKVICPIAGLSRPGLCSTDDLTVEQWAIVGAIVGFYFVTNWRRG